LLERKTIIHSNPEKGCKIKEKSAEYGKRMNRMRNDPFRIYIF
jgi:hypothetical protein